VHHLPSSLQHLNLSHNQLGTAAARMLVYNLPPLLEHLDLSYNSIGQLRVEHEDEDEDEEDTEAVKEELWGYLYQRVRFFYINDSEDSEDEDYDWEDD